MSVSRPQHQETSPLITNDQASLNSQAGMQEEPLFLGQQPSRRERAREIANTFKFMMLTLLLFVYMNALLPIGRFVKRNFSLSSLFLIIIGLATASTNGINALFAISGYSPKDILKGNWWRYMDDFRRALSVLSGASSWVINTALFYFLGASLKDSLISLRREFGQGSAAVRAIIIAVLFMGLLAAAPPFAIAYDAWDWSSLDIMGDAAIPFALFAAFSNAASAIVSRMKGMEATRLSYENSKKEYMQVTNQYLETLSRTNPAKRHLVNAEMTKSVQLVLWNERLYKLQRDGIQVDSREWKLAASVKLNKLVFRKLEILFNHNLVNLNNAHPDLFQVSRARYYGYKVGSNALF